MKQVNILKNLFYEANRIVIMTGAGMSVPSGIPDFRGANGLYQKNPEEILSYTYFKKYPEKFYAFYRQNMIYLNAKPNIGHKTLAHLESMGKVKTIITQNIDGLHQSAGSKNVIELHGSIHKNYCMKCRKYYSISKIMATDEVPICECGGIIKPDIILYEESLSHDAIENSLKSIEKADLLIVIGTSLLVYPAASLIHYFNGSNLVIINKDITPYDDEAQLVIQQPLENILTPELFKFKDKVFHI